MLIVQHKVGCWETECCADMFTMHDMADEGIRIAQACGGFSYATFLQILTDV